MSLSGAGVKINRIVNLDDDLAWGLRPWELEIIAPIGKGRDWGGEPNKNRETVFFKEIVGRKNFFTTNRS
jgi:DNA segregation ATPase FtsK/SpoIIIE-like protein